MVASTTTISDKSGNRNDYTYIKQADTSESLIKRDGKLFTRTEIVKNGKKETVYVAIQDGKKSDTKTIFEQERENSYKPSVSNLGGLTSSYDRAIDNFSDSIDKRIGINKDENKDNEPFKGLTGEDIKKHSIKAVKEIGVSIAKHPILTGATVAATITLSYIFPPAGLALIGIGALTSGIGVGSGIYKAKTAKTHSEATAAVESITTNAIGLITSVIPGLKFLKASKAASTASKAAVAAEKAAADAGKVVTTAAEAAKKVIDCGFWSRTGRTLSKFPGLKLVTKTCSLAKDAVVATAKGINKAYNFVKEYSFKDLLARSWNKTKDAGKYLAKGTKDGAKKFWANIKTGNQLSVETDLAGMQHLETSFKILMKNPLQNRIAIRNVFNQMKTVKQMAGKEDKKAINAIFKEAKKTFENSRALYAPTNVKNTAITVNAFVQNPLGSTAFNDTKNSQEALNKIYSFA